MASTLTKEQMFAQILEQDAAKLDVIADTRRMSAIVAPLVLEGQNEIVLDVDTPKGLESFALSPHARGQVSNDLGIPKKYFDRMLVDAPSLLASNVNHWLANQPERRLVRGFKPTGASTCGTGRAFVSDRFKRMDNIEIAKKLFPVFDEIEGLTFHQAQLTDTKFYLRALLPSLEREIKVGDPVQAGVEIRNSEVGCGQLVIQPFVLRLICLNGMTVNDFATAKRHVGKRIEDETFYSDEAVEADDNAFWLVARDNLKAALTEVRFEEIVGRLAEIVHGEKIQAPIAATEQLAQRFSLTDGEREAVLRNLVSEGDLSQWGLLNAVTATAKEADTFDRQADLEELGWTIAQLPTKEWASIAVA
jgi:hypothetical protein